MKYSILKYLIKRKIAIIITQNKYLTNIFKNKISTKDKG